MAEGRHRAPSTTLADVATGAVAAVRALADIPKELRTRHLNSHWGDTADYEGQPTHYRRQSAAQPEPTRDPHNPHDL